VLHSKVIFDTILSKPYFYLYFIRYLNDLYDIQCFISLHISFINVSSFIIRVSKGYLTRKKWALPKGRQAKNIVSAKG